MKKQTLRTILLLSLGFAVGLGVIIPLNYLSDAPAAEAPTVKRASSTAKPLSVTVTTPRQDVVLDGIRSVGTLLPIEQVDVSAEIAGKASAILFSEGQKITKGDPLVKINDDDLQAKMLRYTYQEKTLGEKLERQRILLAKEAVSQEAYDAVETEYNVLRADMAVLEVSIKRSVVRAPFSGIVGLRYISEGAYLQPTTRITSIVDQNTILVEFSIPEKYISRKLVGQKIFFTIEGSDRKFQAVIYAAEPKIDEATRTIILRARYDNRAGLVHPGMSARITIPTSGEATRLLIPSETIVPTMTGKSVWVVVDGVATERTVTTGVRLERDVEVLSGVELGDSIIVNGILHVREGVAVSVKM